MTIIYNSLKVPTVSRSMLKEHSTSSVELAQRISAGNPFLTLNFLLHSLDTVLVVSATSVSLVKSLMLVMVLNTKNLFEYTNKYKT